MGDTSHVVPLPRWVFFIRIAQAVLAVLIVALVGFSTYVYGSTYMVEAYGVNLCTGPLTLIVVAYNALSPIFAASLYNCWAALALEIFTLIMWLVSFAILASYTSNFSLWFYTDTFYTDNYYWKQKRSLTLMDYNTAWRTGAAASGLGGLEFILWIITLVIFSIYLHRHRASTAQPPPVYAAPANGYDTKVEAVATVQQSISVQQAYPQPANPQQYGAPQPNPQQQYQQPQPVQPVQQPQQYVPQQQQQQY